jgi:hypothetical protein
MNPQAPTTMTIPSAMSPRRRFDGILTCQDWDAESKSSGSIWSRNSRNRSIASSSASSWISTPAIGRVRAFLSVDKLGQPSVGAASALAAEFFHPLGAATPPTVEFARALDAIVALRAIVASPTNGVYAICTAGLTGTPVRHVD